MAKARQLPRAGVKLESTTRKTPSATAVNSVTRDEYSARTSKQLSDARVAFPETPMPFLQTITWIARAFRERRHSSREPVRYKALIDTGEGTLPLHCTVLNVSEDGARVLLTSYWIPLPEEFSLVFTRYGMIRRRCRMVWRSGADVGVTYVRPLVYEDSSQTDDEAFRSN
jgi:hypothetical protein